MESKQFNETVDKTLKNCTNVLCNKAQEYASNTDRLHNFKVAAALQNLTPAQALHGMMSKHIVSIADMCMSGEKYSAEMWDEKITDGINYLLLLRTLIKDVGLEI